MRLFEFSTSPNQTEELVALAQFFLARAEDTGSEKEIKVDAFLKVAHNMGISFTRDQLIAQADKEPLSNLIDNIEGDVILFKGNDAIDSTMSVKKAENVVDKMSKRALNRG